MAKRKKLPKRVAGVKVPKRLRKSGGKAVELLSHPLVADLVAAALISAANAIRKSETARTTVSKLRVNAEEAADSVKLSAAGLGQVIAEKAREGLERVGENLVEASKASAFQPTEKSPKQKKKRKTGKKKRDKKKK